MTAVTRMRFLSRSVIGWKGDGGMVYSLCCLIVGSVFVFYAGKWDGLRLALVRQAGDLAEDNISGVIGCRTMLHVVRQRVEQHRMTARMRIAAPLLSEAIPCLVATADDGDPLSLCVHERFRRRQMHMRQHRNVESVAPKLQHSFGSIGDVEFRVPPVRVTHPDTVGA